MTFFTSRLPKEDNQSGSSHNGSDSVDKSGKKFSIIKDLFSHQKKNKFLTKSLIRIIGVIVSAGILVGLYELFS